METYRSVPSQIPVERMQATAGFTVHHAGAPVERLANSVVNF